MRNGPLVIIGDTLLDVDIEGSAERLSPDAPVPVVDCRRERHRAGGAGLAAVLGASLPGPGVVLVTALGNDRAGERLRGILSRHVEVLPVPLRGSTPCKIRVRASGQSLVRLDTGDGRAAAGPFGTRIERALTGAGAVLVCDYGRGMAAHPAITALLRRLPRDIPVIWDPHPAGTVPAAGARLVTPNRAEARTFAMALGYKPQEAAGPIAQAGRDVSRLAAAWSTAVAVTLGEAGALLSVGDAVPMLAPAAPLDSVSYPDACGAGDCFAVTAARVLGAGGLLAEAVIEAVCAASAFVGAGGAATSPSEVIPSPADDDPVRRQSLAGAPAGESADAVAGDVVAGVRARGGSVVATGGCFDLLHAGHVGLLREARRLGDCLIVCLNSDSSVRALKGPGRPLVTEQDRARVLAALECVDAVVVFDEPTPSLLLEQLRPDVWVKGGDYARTELAEAEVVRRHGGQVVLLPYVDRHSTSAIVAAASRIPAADGALTGQQA